MTPTKRESRPSLITAGARTPSLGARIIARLGGLPFIRPPRPILRTVVQERARYR